MRPTVLAGMTAFVAIPVPAEPVLSIPLPLTEESNVVPAEYDCPESGKVSVSYINAGENSLAIISTEDMDRVFVNVISASGSRYVSGEYEWWSKGDTATFTNLTQDENAQECSS